MIRLKHTDFECIGQTKYNYTIYCTVLEESSVITELYYDPVYSIYIEGHSIGKQYSSYLIRVNKLRNSLKDLCSKQLFEEIDKNWLYKNGVHDGFFFNSVGDCCCFIVLIT